MTNKSNNLPLINQVGALNAPLPKHLQERQSDEAAELITSFLGMPNLSIKGKQFRFIDSTGEELILDTCAPMDVIILGFDPLQGVAKAYYAKQYIPGSDDPPDCSSADGCVPDSFISKPISESCTLCPKNQFGSGTDAQGNPSRGKACKDTKILFLVHAEDIDGPILGLRVPVTSLKALGAYGKHLAKYKIRPRNIITRLRFADSEFPQLEFEPISYLDEAQCNIIDARAESEELKSLMPSVNRTVNPFLEEQKTSTESETVEEEEEEETALALPPPPISATPPAPPPPPKKSKMTDKAEGLPYDDWIAQGWTDELLIEHGYMTQ